MHDAIAAERLGIPSVAIMTDRFVQTAQALARLQGVPDYPFIAIAHPISDNSDDVLRAKALKAVVDGVKLLRQRRELPP